jgi:DNA-binding MarR family transcriptional regulator
VQEQILAYLRRAGTPENLARSLGVASDQLNEALDEMEAKGWIGRGAAWFGNDPSTAITVIMLRPAGRKEAERRRILSGEYDVSTCVVVTRDELIAELKRDFEWTSESPKSRRCATNGSTFGQPYADGPGCRMIMPTSLDNGQRSPRPRAACTSWSCAG